MYMKVNIQFIKAERAKRVWTQQHLADVTDLSLRTIQRIESTGASGAESIKAIAAALDVEPDVLLSGSNDTGKTSNFHWYDLYKQIPLESKSIAFLSSILILIAIPAIFLRSNNAVGNADIFQFEGGIRINDSQLENFGVILRSDQMFILDVDARHKLVMEVTDSDGEPREPIQTKIRLLQNDGTNYNVLHSSVRPGPENHLHTVSYRVCGENVVYYGPSVKNIPDCNESPANTSINEF